MSNDSVLEGLYPFLHGRAQEPEQLDAALLHSVAEKAGDSRDTNARFFAEQGKTLVAAAHAVAEVYRAVRDGQWRLLLRRGAYRG
jgi:D-sedoheptulose 7-phosphate isomerase